MAPKIYTSSIPPFEVAEHSIYSHIFPKNDPFPGDTAAFIDADTGNTLTRAVLRRITLELAWGLKHVLHANFRGPALARGDTVLVFSQNSVSYPIVMFGAFAAGICATLANSAYTPTELAHQYKDSQAKVVFAHKDLVPVAVKMFELLGVDAKEARSRIIIASWNENDRSPKGFIQMEDLLGKGRLEIEENFDGPLSNETALLCYSSGTTGKPKGVETTHRNLTSVLSMIRTVFPIKYGQDVTIGATNLLQSCPLDGIPVVTLSRFDPVAFCRTIEQYKITFAFIVPPILVIIARHPAVSQYNISSIRRLLSGAAPLGAGLTKAVNDRLNSLGVKARILQGYGLTETSPTTHIVPLEDAERKIGSIGVLFPNLEARLVTEDGREAGEGEPGELWIRGPTVMKGYLNNPTATKSSITPDGWFQTGDIGTVDNEGYYFIVDRKKELIKYKGFQVPPAELEAILLLHPDISDAGVVGIESHAEATELPRAYIVHANGIPGTVEERRAFAASVQKWIEGRVARHKFLRGGVAVVEMIPKRQGAPREVVHDAPAQDEGKDRQGRHAARPRAAHSHPWKNERTVTDFVVLFGLDSADSKVVYRRYASLFFVCGVGSNDNELVTLEIIHRYVEVLDRYFGNVCELDLIFNFQKAYAILDELIIAGELQESSKKSVLRVVAQSDAIEEQENSEDTLARIGSRSL
ncbi:hypothetical protein EW145_g2566 [Phellinidium pouzarii]|uniref:AP complex mu/sigma subunit domain-containing protein n=1 Tax=Phellinidium pouzarii TaxID=167371 RepID=A0A4S4LBW7_9AGAM|nr:hypothetical protein EW145_g2566 [Phellinidium pouzarii]